MSDMTEQAKTYMQDLRGCVAGEDPYFPTADELPIIDHIIAALTIVEKQANNPYREAIEAVSDDDNADFLITADRLCELRDAELIAWGLTADLNDDGLTLGWCNHAKAWRLTTLMANESESEQERLKGNVRYRYLGSKKRPNFIDEDGPEARAILAAAMKNRGSQL